MDADSALKAPSETPGRTPPSDLGTCVTGLVNAVARGMAQIVAPHGLVHIDFALLRLFLMKEEWTSTQLALTLPLPPSTISRSMSKLVKKGLVRRRRLSSDRRVLELTLTEKGRALTRELHQQVQAYDSMLCQGVSKEEMAALAAVSSKVTANFAALGPPGKRRRHCPVSMGAL